MIIGTNETVIPLYPSDTFELQIVGDYEAPPSVTVKVDGQVWWIVTSDSPAYREGGSPIESITVQSTQDDTNIKINGEE